MRKPNLRQKGVSLIGTLVALVIGVIVCTIALGTASFYEANRRTSLGRDNALTNGAIGILSLEGLLKSAGTGLMANQSFACPTANLASYATGPGVDSDGNPITVTITKRNGTALFPLTIAAGGTGSDTIEVVRMASLTSAAATRLLLPMASETDTVKVASLPTGTVVGDLIVLKGATAGTVCTFREITAITETAYGQEIAHDTGTFNSAQFTTPHTYEKDDFVSVSKGMSFVTYRIQNNALVEVNNMDGSSVTLSEGIVGMKAQYGVVTNGATSWTTSESGTYSTPTVTNMLKVQSVRVGLIARSSERDAQCPTTLQNMPVWPGGPTVDLSATATGNEWKCYRYRAYDISVPLVNVVMGLK